MINRFIIFKFLFSIIFLLPNTGYSQTRQGLDLDGKSVNDNQGWSVSLSENGLIMAVGAYYHESGKGTARVYQFINDSWSQLGLDIDGLQGDRQGSSVALSNDGTILAIGAYQHDDGRGTVRVYKYSLDSWNQLGEKINGIDSSDEQGISVALSNDGTILAVGAQKHDNNKGTVRVYEYNSGSWSQLGEDIDGVKEDNRQGYSVSLSDDGLKLSTGAFGHLNNKGTVRIYQYSTGSWSQLGNDIDGIEINDYQGISVSLSGVGNKIATGAFRHDNEKGTVRVYEFLNDSWTQLGTDIDGVTENGRQGSSVSLSNDGLKLAVGAQYHDGGKGTARYYEYKNDTWSQLGSNMDGDGSDYQGRSVSLSYDGSILAVGAPDHDNVKGTVRVYKLVNFAPTANPQNVSVTEQTDKTITLVGSDAEGDALTYIISSLPSNGTLTDDGTLINIGDLPKTIKNTDVVYKSTSDSATSDSFTFKVNDAISDSSPASVTISITPVNDIPIATPQTGVSTTEQVAATITLSGTDADGDTLTYAIVDSPSNGNATLDGSIVTYTSTSDTATSDSFTFKVNDGTVDSAKATISINITAVNDPPVANSQNLTVIEDKTLEIILSGTDIDEDALTYALVDNPTNGTVSLTESKVTYVPSAGYFGSDSFTFKVNDGTIDSEKGTVSITITSNDLDEDGILNDDDQCPNTPAGTPVDVNGCTVFTLPVNNNKVEVTSATCIGNTDGSIGLSVEDNSHDYTITITGKDPVAIAGENKTASVTGLAKGTYTVCFKVDGQANYKQCFEVVIGEPKALSAFIDVDNDKRTTSIDLSGSNLYNVDINGQRHLVKGDNFTTTLSTGLSIIKISTNLDCQGVIEREIFISEDILYYPNPTDQDVSVHVSGEDTSVQVSVFSEKGDLIYTQRQQIQDFSRKTRIDLSRQITGTYIVVMDGTTVRKTFKIIKR